MNKKDLQWLRAFLVPVFLTGFMLLQMSAVQSAESASPEKALNFLQNVVRLDLARYNVTLASCYTEYPSELGGLPQTWFLYTFESEESKMDVQGQLIGDTLVWLKVYPYKGSLILSEPLPDDVLGMAKRFMQRYQNYSKAAYIQQMLSILEHVSELKSSNVTVGNVKLIISLNGPSTDIEWIYTSNGMEFPGKKVAFAFKSGKFISFMDQWNIYRIGSDDVNVDADEAVSIAREALKDIPTLYMRKGNETIAVKPTLGGTPPRVRLLTAAREPLTLYPLWYVQLYFDQVYGMYYAVAVEIWADTGEIRTIYPLGFMGATSPPSNTPPATQTPPWPQTPTETPQGENPLEQPEQPEENPPAGTEPEQKQNTNISTMPLIAALTITAATTITLTVICKKTKLP